MLKSKVPWVFLMTVWEGCVTALCNPCVEPKFQAQQTATVWESDRQLLFMSSAFWQSKKQKDYASQVQLRAFRKGMTKPCLFLDAPTPTHRQPGSLNITSCWTQADRLQDILMTAQ
eukprot:78718-Pelagomonas_calceolata.AAC.2